MSQKYSLAVQAVAIGVGAALFFVLGRFAALPTPIPNTTINFQYALLAVLAVIFGPIVAALIGGIGHVLIDATGYGIWVSWELASVIFGLVVGFLVYRNRVAEGELNARGLIRFNLAVVVAQAVAFLLVAPLGDILIYSEPVEKVFVQGAMAFVSNSITACVVGSVLLLAFAKSRTKTGALAVEND